MYIFSFCFLRNNNPGKFKTLEERIQTPSSHPPTFDYPQRQEMVVLMELVESVRVDLLQTAMLQNHMKDYLQTMHR